MSLLPGSLGLGCVKFGHPESRVQGSTTGEVPKLISFHNPGERSFPHANQVCGILASEHQFSLCYARGENESSQPPHPMEHLTATADGSKREPRPPDIMKMV